MRIQIIKCDRCGSEISGYPIKILPKCVSYTNETVKEISASPYEESQKHKDYCMNCCTAIIKFVNTTVTENQDDISEDKEVVPVEKVGWKKAERGKHESDG